jgi:hypothetical protein
MEENDHVPQMVNHQKDDKSASKKMNDAHFGCKVTRGCGFKRLELAAIVIKSARAFVFFATDNFVVSINCRLLRRRRWRTAHRSGQYVRENKATTN